MAIWRERRSKNKSGESSPPLFSASSPAAARPRVSRRLRHPQKPERKAMEKKACTEIGNWNSATLNLCVRGIVVVVNRFPSTTKRVKCRKEISKHNSAFYSAVCV